MDPNFSTRNKFKAQVNFPDMSSFEFMIKSFTFGGLNIGTYTYPTPIRNIEYPGDSYNADDAAVDFFVDEDWESYIEIFNWMKNIKSTSTGRQQPLLLGDMTIEILNTKFRPTLNVVMRDIWPMSITSMNIDTDDDASPLMAQVLFKVNSYEILPKN